MQVSTSTDWPPARGSGLRTTSRKVSSGSPLGRVRISAGAEIRPRRTTSFRSITATLMQASLLRRSRPAQHPAASVDTAGPVDDRSPRCRRSVRAGAVLVLVVCVAVVLVVASGVRRRFDLRQELSYLSRDVLVEAPSEPVVFPGERRPHL